jgi:hypothetical protein
MLTLLKQARAFGLGIVLATQNPVDLDYKGLSNAGTWFLGRLQTKRDKDRVLVGLEGASTAAGHAFDRQKMDEILSSLGSRIFVMHNVSDEQPIVFQTRWTLSYLRGPLTREQIQALMAVRRQDRAAQAGSHSSGPSLPPVAASGITCVGSASARPVVPPDVPEFFLPRRDSLQAGEALEYRPALLGVARLHYAETKANIDYWETVAMVYRVVNSLPSDIWSQSDTLDGCLPELDKSPEAGAVFAPMPVELARAKNYVEWGKALKNYLYRERTLEIYRSSELKQWSRAKESEREFRLRLVQASREERDQKVEALRAKYAPKLEAVADQIRRARQRLAQEQAQANRSTWDATIAVGNSVLGALLGRKSISKANVTGAARAAKAAGRAAQERGDVSQAADTVEVLQRKHTDLEAKFQDEVEALVAALRPESLQLERVALRPRKTDITVERVVLAWMPCQVRAEAQTVAAY